jgi:hypothetical protein
MVLPTALQALHCCLEFTSLFGFKSKNIEVLPCRLLLDPLSLAASARRRAGQQPTSAADAEAADLAAQGASWEELERERYRQVLPKHSALGGVIG